MFLTNDKELVVISDLFLMQSCVLNALCELTEHDSIDGSAAAELYQDLQTETLRT